MSAEITEVERLQAALKGEAEEVSKGAGPVDTAAVQSVIEEAQQAPKKRGRPVGWRKKPKEPEVPPVPPIDPAMMLALKGTLVSAYELALTMIASAQVAFTDEERPAVGDGIVYCIETYLPQGFNKHVPLVFLGVISLQAVSRAREQKKESERNA